MSEQSSCLNIDFAKRLRDSEALLMDAKARNRGLLIVLLVVFFVYICLKSVAVAYPTRYLTTTPAGFIEPMASFNVPLLEYEDRLDIARRVVQTVNSLINNRKDEMLSDISRYFSPNVFKSFILRQYNSGFFMQMKTYDVSYISRLSPGHLHKDEPVFAVYADDVCYEPGVMGDSYKAGVDCRASKAVNRFSETFLFDVERYVNVAGKINNKQIFKVRLVLTRVESSRGVKGFMVSEYTEL